MRSHYIRLANRFANDPDMGIEAMREMLDTLQHRQAEPTGVTYEEVVAGGRPALWARPLDAEAGRVILYTPTPLPPEVSPPSDRKP